MSGAAVRLALALSAVSACASVSRPPGGPEDTDPPQIVAASIDTNATNVSAEKLDVQFNEVISERPSAVGRPGAGAVTLEAVVLVSPRTGTPKVGWHRDRMSIEPRGGFRPNTTYRITLLPGIADIRGNVRQETSSIVFSTGPSLHPFSILGRVFDWQANGAAPASIVEAVANPGTKDSLIFVTVADSTGQFEVGPLGAGKYLIRTFIDADRNRDQGVLEKWDSVTVQVTDHRPTVELRAIQRDSAPVGIQRVEVMDSTWIRLVLDKPYDPRTILQPALVILKRADSSVVEVAAVMTDAQSQFLRRPDSTARDTTAPRPAPPPTPTPARAATDTLTRPPAPKPSQPPPEQNIVLRLSPANALKAGEAYSVTIRGIRNLVGRTDAATYPFLAPKPAAKPAAKPPP